MALEQPEDRRLRTVTCPNPRCRRKHAALVRDNVAFYACSDECREVVAAMRMDRPHFLPTPEEIAAECLRIQAEWSDEERESRDRQAGRVPAAGAIEARTPQIPRRKSA